MATAKQRQAARRNIRKAQETWHSMGRTARARSQPEGRGRARPGTRGGGNYYRVMVRPKSEFVTFRTQDVGEPGHEQRVAGKRASGSWATASWLISKEDAHIENHHLIPDTRGARQVLERLGSEPVHQRGDLFIAKDRPNIPEPEKPTAAQRRARSRNIRKAQAARHQAR